MNVSAEPDNGSGSLMYSLACRRDGEYNLTMEIPLEKLGYRFTHKPLLIGGWAMEYYGLRKAGNDIDLMAAREDMAELIRLYPDTLKNVWEDLGVCPFEFEIWTTICLFDYDYYKQDALEQERFLIVSLEKLLFMKALASKKAKYLNDLHLIVAHIIKKQGTRYIPQKKINAELLQEIKNSRYIEKVGPETI